MDLSEALFQYSIDTKEYGKLYFMVYPDPDKNSEIQKIKQNSPDDNSFIENTFNALYLRGTKNEKKLKEIDFSKITEEEFLDFKNQFFFRQFCEYKYNPELSWEDNIKEGNKFQDERMLEVGRNLSSKLSIDLKGITDSPTLKAMRELSDSLDKIYRPKLEPIKPFFDTSSVSFQQPRNYVLETEYKILDESQNINTNIQNLSELITNLINVTNCLKTTQENQLKTSIEAVNVQSENAKKQSEKSEQESKKSTFLSYIAIGISVIALLFDIGINLYSCSSSKNTDFKNQEFEEKKIELLQSLNDNHFINEEIENLKSKISDMDFNISDIHKDIQQFELLLNKIDSKIEKDESKK